jgi:hypothetical protein
MATDDLLLTRMKQLELKDQNVGEVIAHIAHRQLEAKELWDEKHEWVIRPEGEDLEVGDMVLLKNVQLEKGFGRKLDFRWLGPYRIVEAMLDRNYFHLAELDGATFKRTTHGNHLKKFHQWAELEEAEPTGTSMEGVIDIKDLGDVIERLYGEDEGESDEAEEAPAPGPKQSQHLINQ